MCTKNWIQHFFSGFRETLPDAKNVEQDIPPYKGVSLRINDRLFYSLLCTNLVKVGYQRRFFFLKFI